MKRTYVAFAAEAAVTGAFVAVRASAFARGQERAFVYMFGAFTDFSVL